MSSKQLVDEAYALFYLFSVTRITLDNHRQWMTFDAYQRWKRRKDGYERVHERDWDFSEAVTMGRSLVKRYQGGGDE